MADDRKPKEQQGLPEGWKWVRFKDYVYFQEGPGLTSDLFEGRSEGIPFLNIRCIQNNQLLKDKLQFVDENIVRKHFKHFLLQENDLVVSSSGTLGRTLFIKKEHLPLLLNTSIIRMRPKNESLSRFYLKYFIESEFFQKEIYRLSTGSAQSNYGPSHLKRIFLILPPLPEQRKIAEILETVDNAIEKTEKIIEKYKRIKQGLMQDLLTKGIDEKGNIRSEKTHKFKDSPLGRIPEEWEVVRLGEVVEIYDNKRIPLSEEERANRKGIYPYCGANGIIDHIDSYIFEGEYLLLAEDGGFFGRFENSAYLMSGKFWVNNHAHVLKAREGVSVNGFILAWLIFDDLSRYISGTTRQKLNQSAMRNILIPLPPLSEQKRIAEILSQIDQAIEKEEKYKQKLERLKKGLMEDLLTGKVRVNKLLEGENYETA